MKSESELSADLEFIIKRPSDDESETAASFTVSLTEKLIGDPSSCECAPQAQQCLHLFLQNLAMVDGSLGVEFHQELYDKNSEWALSVVLILEEIRRSRLPPVERDKHDQMRAEMERIYGEFRRSLGSISGLPFANTLLGYRKESIRGNNEGISKDTIGLLGLTEAQYIGPRFLVKFI